MIIYKKNIMDIKIAKEIYLQDLEKAVKILGFNILSNKTEQIHIDNNQFNFVCEHPKFKGDHDNHFQITMNRGIGAEIYPPVRITIWFANEKINFEQTLDLQTTNIESVIYIIEKLISDYC